MANKYAREYNKNYIHTGIFPKELGRKIITAEEIRHASDYDTFYIASKDLTSQQIQTAGQLFILATEYLKKERGKETLLGIAYDCDIHGRHKKEASSGTV